MLKLLESLVLISFLMACSKGKGGSKGPAPVVSYSAVYEYPVAPTLNPGDGKVYLNANGLSKCLDSDRNEVALSKCPPVSEAPVKVVESPAGTVTIVVPGAVGGFALISVAEGEHYPSLALTDVNSRVATTLSCDSGYVKVAHECKIPGYELILSSYSSPTLLSVCSGTETLSRSVLGCRDSITMLNTDPTNCNGMTDPAPMISHQSPAGTRTITSGSNTIAQSCALGASVWTQTDITCGNPEEHKNGSGALATCEPDVFIASNFVYPANTVTNPGDGQLTVSATSFSTCTNTSKGTVAALGKCAMPSPAPTTLYESPAGTKNVTSGTTIVHNTCAQGSTTCTKTDITCNDPEEHKSGSGAAAICVPDVFVASDFVYPPSTVTNPGDGQETVSATSFSTCTNTSKSTAAAIGKCSMPSPAPTTLHESPAGTKDTLSGSMIVHNYCAQGSTTCTQTDVTCNDPDEHKSGSGASASCETDIYTASDFTYPANTVTNPGDGTVTVSASGFTTCTNTSKSIPALTSKCSIPLPAPTMTYESPAGNKDVTSGSVTIHQACLAASTSCTQTDVTCNDVNQHKSGSGSTATCVNDTFIASDFTYPANALTACDGTSTVDANAFTTCTNTTKSTSVATSFCSMPSPAPTTNYSSPAGTKSTAITNGTQNTACALGATTGTVTYTCDTGFRNVGTQCVGGPVSVALGYQHGCALMADGTTKCHGTNTSGQIGNGTTTAVTTPTAITQWAGAKEIYSANAHTCAIMTNGKVFCTGNNGSGQLGNGNTTNATSPVEATAFANATQLALGASFTCALFADTTVKCAGINNHGFFGNGSTSSAANHNVSCPNFTGATKIYAGSSILCAKMSNGSVKCAGYNINGAMGNGTYTSPVSTAYTVTGLQNAEELQVSDYVCARFSDDTVKCQGNNPAGTFGNGTTTKVNTATVITQWAGAKKLIGGFSFLCAQFADKTVKCSGDNTYGTFGNGTTTSSTTPTTTGFNDAISLHGGWFVQNLCGTLSDGTYRCSGSNSAYQLGTGGTANQTSPYLMNY